MEGSELCCRLCRKCFDRKELRDRHSKRCMRNFDKPRRSKQRSCARCARVKVKCSLDVPSCQRCLHRGLCCEYPPKFRSPLQTTIQSHNKETPLSTSPNTINTPSIASESTPAEITDQSSSYTSSDTKSISSDVEQTGMAGEPSIWQLYPPNLLDQSLPCLELMDICLFPNCNEDAVCDELPDAIGDSWKFDTIDPQSYGNYMDKCTYQNILGVEDILLGKDLSPNDPANISESQSMPSSYEELEEDDIGMEHDRPIARLPESPTVDDLLNYVRHFPRYMKRTDYQLPFVHSQLNSQGDFDVDGPVTISPSPDAMARHFLYESSQPLIGETFHQGEAKTIEGSDTLDSLEKGLAIIQSSCLSQISRDLDESMKIPTPPWQSTRSQHKSALEMTRQSCRKYHALLTTKHSDWPTWRIAESLRRTIHLVDVVNKLCCYRNESNARNDKSSLDGEFILDLALPSSNSMWKATDAATWDLARRRCDSQVVTTRMVLNASAPATCDFNDSSSAVLDESREFSRLIIATALLKPIGQDIKLSS